MRAMNTCNVTWRTFAFSGKTFVSLIIHLSRCVAATFDRPSARRLPLLLFFVSSFFSSSCSFFSSSGQWKLAECQSWRVCIALHAHEHVSLSSFLKVTGTINRRCLCKVNANASLDERKRDVSWINSGCVTFTRFTYFERSPRMGIYLHASREPVDKK